MNNADLFLILPATTIGSLLAVANDARKHGRVRPLYNIGVVTTALSGYTAYVSLHNGPAWEAAALGIAGTIFGISLIAFNSRTEKADGPRAAFVRLWYELRDHWDMALFAKCTILCAAAFSCWIFRAPITQAAVSAQAAVVEKLKLRPAVKNAQLIADTTKPQTVTKTAKVSTHKKPHAAVSVKHKQSKYAKQAHTAAHQATM